MRSTRPVVLAFVSMLVATSARAHVVTIFPSTCAATIGLSAPASGLVAVVDPPTAGDLLRVVYDPEAHPDRSRVQVCPADPVDPQNRCGASIPRAFTLGTHTGSIAPPTFFALQLLSDGELHATGIPLTVTLDGTPVAVAMELASGFIEAGGELALGSPIDASGAVSLVGVGRSAALPPPLTDVDLLLTLSCTLAPVPDLDQFALAPRLAKVKGVLTKRARTLTTVLETDATLPASFGAGPTRLRLGPQPLVDVRVDGGLAPAGAKGFSGTADDGTKVSVKTLKRPGGLAYRLSVRGPGLSDLTSTPSGSLVLESGGLLARTAVAARANRAETRVKIRLP